MPLREYLRRGSSSRSTPPSSSTSQVAAPKCPALPNNCWKKAKHLFKGRRLMSALRSHFTKQRTWAGGSKSERKKETTSNGGTLGYHHISYPAVRGHLNCAKWRGNMRMGWCAGDLITASTHRSKSSAHSTKQARMQVPHCVQHSYVHKPWRQHSLNPPLCIIKEPHWQSIWI